MDRPRQSDQLGVNKIGKNIKKSPMHQPNFANGNTPARPPPQPHVYNISKNDFRSIVQQLTGSPSRDSLPQPPPNPPKPQSTRLQKIRPAALTQINRPHVPPHVMAPLPHVMAPPPHGQGNLARPPAQPYMHPLPHGAQPMMGHGEQFRSNIAESPVSVYMRYLQSSLGDSGPNGNQMQSPHEYQAHMFAQSQPQQHMLTQAQSQQQMSQQPHMNMQGQFQPQQVPGQTQPHQAPIHNHHSSQFNGSASSMPLLPSPRFNGPPQQMYGFPSPQFNGPGLLPTPTSQFLLQSPSAYWNLLSPRSPYPLLSPGAQFPPPLTPRSFTFSPMAQPGILGPGTIPQPPASPGLVFPLSPYGFFPISSPRWRDH